MTPTPETHKKITIVVRNDLASDIMSLVAKDAEEVYMRAYQAPCSPVAPKPKVRSPEPGQSKIGTVAEHTRSAGDRNIVTKNSIPGTNLPEVILNWLDSREGKSCTFPELEEMTQSLGYQPNSARRTLTDLVRDGKIAVSGEVFKEQIQLESGYNG